MRPRPRRRHDEGFGLSGWLYADLLLGLFVVMLAVAPLQFDLLASADEPMEEPSPSPTASAEASPTPEPSPSPTPEPMLAECRALYAPEAAAVLVEIDRGRVAAGDAAYVEDALATALEREGFPPESDLGFVLLFGHSSRGSTGEGITRARETLTSIESMPTRPLGDATTRPYYGGSDLPDEIVQLELFPFVDTCADGERTAG